MKTRRFQNHRFVFTSSRKKQTRHLVHPELDNPMSEHLDPQDWDQTCIGHTQSYSQNRKHFAMPNFLLEFVVHEFVWKSLKPDSQQDLQVLHLAQPSEWFPLDDGLLLLHEDWTIRLDLTSRLHVLFLLALQLQKLQSQTAQSHLQLRLVVKKFPLFLQNPTTLLQLLWMHPRASTMDWKFFAFSGLVLRHAMEVAYYFSLIFESISFSLSPSCFLSWIFFQYHFLFSVFLFCVFVSKISWWCPTHSCVIPFFSFQWLLSFLEIQLCPLDSNHPGQVHPIRFLHRMEVLLCLHCSAPSDLRDRIQFFLELLSKFQAMSFDWSSLDSRSWSYHSKQSTLSTNQFFPLSSSTSFRHWLHNKIWMNESHLLQNQKIKVKIKNLPLGIQSTLGAKNKSVAKNIQVQFAWAQWIPCMKQALKVQHSSQEACKCVPNTPIPMASENKSFHLHQTTKDREATSSKPKSNGPNIENIVCLQHPFHSTIRLVECNFLWNFHEPLQTCWNMHLQASHQMHTFLMYSVEAISKLLHLVPKSFQKVYPIFLGPSHDANVFPFCGVQLHARISIWCEVVSWGLSNHDQTVLFSASLDGG